MATTPDAQPAASQPPDHDLFTPHGSDDSAAWKTIQQALRPIASLKLTVVLFAMSIFIVLAGTLAQVNADIWEVIDQYFRIDLSSVGQDGFPWIDAGAFFVVIDSQIFFPPSFFPSQPDMPDWLRIPFPKGWLIGAVMLLNLFAAHLVRFKVQATSTRLVGGLSVMALGCLVTALVIMSGSGSGAENWISWSALWGLLQVSVLAAGASALYGAATLPKKQNIARCGLGLTALVLMGVLSWTFITGSDARPSDSSLRILYQIVKATVAGLILLAGCIMVFRKRAGIVLLHGGIGLMMVSEVLVGLQAEEAQIRIEEGASRNFVEDIRTVELAFIRTLEDGRETHNVIPANLLKDEEAISHSELPVDVEVLQYIQNSELVIPAEAPDSVENTATAGVGLQRIAIPVRASTGTDTGGTVDATSAYVRLTDKESGEDLGTWLVSIDLDWFSLGWNEQTVSAGGHDYTMQLRFERTYKPYTITLNDISKEDYIGTDTPRDYSSFVRLQDERSGTDRDDVRIWMNNPLRYSGETFYQSSYYPANAIYRGSGEWTSLQVVKNRGWMIPYVSCMIVAVGLCAHFGLVLWRFLQRRQREQTQSMASVETFRQETTSRKQKKRSQTTAVPATPDWGAIAANRVFPATVVLLCAAYLGSKTRMPETSGGRMDLAAFGNIPVVYQGRPKPIDTLARNSLLIVSDQQDFIGRMDAQSWQENWSDIKREFVETWPELSSSALDPYRNGDRPLSELIDLITDQTGEDRGEVADIVYEATSEKQPAIRWLLDVISPPTDLEQANPAREHRVFRIENLEIQATLGLPRRHRFRYAIEEFDAKLPDYLEQLREAEGVAAENPENLTFYQRKVLELRTKLQVFQRLNDAFVPPDAPPLPTAEMHESNPDEAFQMVRTLLQFSVSESARLEEAGLPMAIPMPPGEDDEESATDTGKWLPLSAAILDAYANRILTMYVSDYDGEVPETTLEFNTMIRTYQEGDVDGFNQAVEDYSTMIAGAVPDDVDMDKVRFESFFNHAAPFYYSAALYLIAFVLTCLSWLGFTKAFHRAAFWLIALTSVAHLLAIVGRIYISGRPPVTNLYSSAVFIGIACVLLSMLLEWIYKIGIGNFVASVSGFITLGIAHFLAGDGDTFTVLQAVLDTQFWLATHVVCITLGYATTYVAGSLGLIYITRGVLTPSLTPNVAKSVTRMTYGALCFSIFFSFVGTVLGGLWADDSWGRFWGWDPKENGALIIVLWNALVLHARWGGMVRDRGLAILAVLGNIAVSWSWFGVNELGVGLHSYGFTEGVVMALGLYCLSQLVIVAMGCVPQQYWWSMRENEGEKQGSSA